MMITLVAGEASGDQLGAALIRAILAQHPDARFTGIGGPLMQTEGMDCWWDCSELSVMGLFEVIRHVPRLLKLRRQLIERVLDLQPDVYIGIDAPDFNLGVEKRLKRRSIPVIHYVSPTVWAWRPGRVKTIARATERVLCLFPFEPRYYHDQDVLTDYTGHPMADHIPLQNDAAAARQTLAVSSNGPVIALLPGSRMGEVEKLITPMLEAAQILTNRHPEMKFIVPAASTAIRSYLEAEMQKYPAVKCQLFTDSGKVVMAAADVVVCASGTATLEVMLINRPMVVCYRLAGSTYALAKTFSLVKSRFFALPNILASEPLVPELLQQAVTGERIALEVSQWLEKPDLRDSLTKRFDQLHRTLQTDAAATAARAVLQHISGVGSGSISE
jgi:lipid-A-disaccharide synthase